MPPKAPGPMLTDEVNAPIDGRQGVAARIWQTWLVEEAGSMPDHWRATLDGSQRVWALVMTPTRARVVRGLGPEAGAPAELVLRNQAPRLRALMAGEAGHAVTALAEDDREFVQQVGLLLDAHRRAGEFDGLVLCATPEILLDVLRRDLPRMVRDRIVAEVPRDLMPLSEAELPRALRRALEDDSHEG